MQNLLYVLLLLAGFPVGYFLAWLARDELLAGKKWFLVLSVVCLITAIVVGFVSFNLKFPAILCLFFIIIISQIAMWKSHDRKWVR